MRKIWIIFLLALALAGCKTIQEIKPDTIVDIPLHPADATTEAVTETQPVPPTETEATTEAIAESTETGTQPPGNNTSSGKNTSGSSKPGKQNTSGSQRANTGIPTEAPTQPGTDPPTEPPTETLTEPPTEPPAEAPTQPATEPPTEAPTQPATEPQTEPPAQYDPSGYVPGSLDRGIADAVNTRRQAAGLPALKLDSWLCAIASVRAYETAIVWDHTRPNGTAGITVLNQYGYAYSTAAENLYFGAAGAGTIVDKWMSSEARKNNMLSESAVSIGVGSYTSADGLTYVAAIFVE